MIAAELFEVAQDLGLDVLGAAPAEPYAETERHIRERKTRELFADMRFTTAKPEVSCHPERLLDGARTVVSAALCYYAPEPELGPDEGRLPRYTWRDEYARLRRALHELGERLGGEFRVLVDENDHVDREAAARSGVAFYGKNTMAITRRYGSWVVLGTLVTTVEIEPTPPLDLDCGSCRLCIDACPTGALDEPGVLDATKCLSYWTQAPAPIPDAYRAELGPMVYGCDFCQDVCPWNRGVEKRRARSPLPSRRRRPSPFASGSSRTETSSSRSSSGSTSRARTPAGYAGTRSSRPETSARATFGPRSSGTLRKRTRCCATPPSGRFSG